MSAATGTQIKQYLYLRETGNGFPEVSLLLPLCNELEITVNELLSGERLQAMDYKSEWKIPIGIAHFLKCMEMQLKIWRYMVKETKYEMDI